MLQTRAVKGRKPVEAEPGMSRFGEKSTFLAAAGLLLANRALLGAGVRRRRDGWRRGAQLVLRGEPASFVLSAFGLALSSAGEPATTPEALRAHCASRLAAFFANEPATHRCIERGRFEDRVIPCPKPSYTLGFEPWVDGPHRFLPPAPWTSADDEAPGLGRVNALLNVVCRIRPDGVVDVWWRINHIGMDGAEAQEILSRLESAWGAAEQVIYPCGDAFTPHAAPRACPGSGDLVDTQAFIDFEPLLQWRREENKRLREPMTLAAAFIWRVCQHPAFSGLHVGTTVDVPEVGGIARGVGIVVTRPADYARRSDGLAQYVTDFNRQLDLTRRRESNGFKFLDAAALMHPWLAATVLRRALLSAPAFGSMGVTVLRDAKVFGAPMGDFGHPRGFIAVGGVGLSTEGGGSVGCVTARGPRVVSDYPRLIREVIQHCVAGG